MSCDPEEGAVKQQSVQPNDTCDGHKRGFGFSRVWLRISTQQMCFTARFFSWKLSWGTSAWGKQAALCPSDYSKQICGHKYDTLSSRWFMKSVLTAEFFCGACLRRRHVWSKPRSIRPIIGGRTEKPVTHIYVTNEERRDQPKNLTWTKNTHTACTRL